MGAATGDIGTAEAKKDVQDAAKQVAGERADDQAGKQAVAMVKKADKADAKAAAKPIQLTSVERLHFNAVRDTLDEAISDVQKTGDSEEDVEDATHNALMELTDEEDDDDEEHVSEACGAHVKGGGVQFYLSSVHGYRECARQ